ncbi:MAG: SOS response-associated peptidase [Candidatus Berkiella sp.]
MCGRFALHASQDEIVSHFQTKGGFVMKPRYNIAPTQIIPIIQDWQSTIEFARWGFLAPWTKAQDDHILTGHINARLESILEKPTFKEAIQKRRCLIPASGYFEWRTIGKKKQPYYLVVKNNPLIAFAGIWSSWRAQSGEEVRTCAIITHNATGELLSLHERMPLIIAKEDYQHWLAKDYDFKDLVKALVHIPSENIGIKPVSPSMNNPRVEGIDCIRPLS